MVLRQFSSSYELGKMADLHLQLTEIRKKIAEEAAEANRIYEEAKESNYRNVRYVTAGMNGVLTSVVRELDDLLS